MSQALLCNKANLAVDCRSGAMRPRPLMNCFVNICCARFANGTQGRVMFWYPEQAKEKRKQVPSSFHHLYVRFVKESSLGKSELLPASRRSSTRACNRVYVCVCDWMVGCGRTGRRPDGHPPTTGKFNHKRRADSLAIAIGAGVRVPSVKISTPCSS